MKLKIFTLGLLSTLVLAGQAEAMMKKTYQAPVESQKMKEQIAEAEVDLGEKPKDLRALVAPKKDVKTGLDDLHANLGAGGGHPDAHKKVKHLMTLVEPAQDLTTGITHTNTLLGVGYEDAADALAAIGAAIPAALPGAAAAALQIALNHPAAKLAGALAGHAVPNDSAKKAGNLLARLNAAAHNIGDGGNHVIVYKGNYPSIEAFITAQGW